MTENEEVRKEVVAEAEHGFIQSLVAARIIFGPKKALHMIHIVFKDYIEKEKNEEKDQ